MKNRYKEVLAHILDIFSPVDIDQAQFKIAAFLEYAERDDFWAFVEGVRKKFQIKVMDHEKWCKDFFPGIKSRADLLRYYRRNKKIKESVYQFLRKQPKAKKYVHMKFIINLFISFDLSSLSWSLLPHIVNGYFSPKYGVEIVRDTLWGENSYIRIFKNTTGKKLRDALTKDKTFEAEFKKAVIDAPLYTPLKQRHPKYWEQLPIELGRLTGKSYSALLSEKTEYLSTDELLNSYGANKEEKELSRMRKLRSKKKEKKR